VLHLIASGEEFFSSMLNLSIDCESIADERGLPAFSAPLCIAIHQILLVSRKIYPRRRGRLRSIKVIGFGCGSVALCSLRLCLCLRPSYAA